MAQGLTKLELGLRKQGKPDGLGQEEKVFSIVMKWDLLWLARSELNVYGVTGGRW